MRLDVYSVGTRMPSWLLEGWSEYAKRMPPHLPLNLIEIDQAHPKEPKRSAIEASRLLAKTPDRARKIALQGSANPWSTEQLKLAMERWLADGDPVCFYIGGADGLDPALIAQCDDQWSLGPAVFPHMLVRVIVAEQLYRAWSMTQGHPYHRGDSA